MNKLEAIKLKCEGCGEEFIVFAEDYGDFVICPFCDDSIAFHTTRISISIVSLEGGEKDSA